jgi:hypothetical protein
LLTAAPVLAQESTIDFGEVTITGTRMIKLPPARKGEVVDSSVYVLPARDTLLFGARISNFGGPGGALPSYREFDPPASAHGEASFGTYLSPRVMAHGEYSRRSFDLMGTVDYRATAGHTDSAGASSLMFDVRGGVLLGGEDPTAPRVRITAGFDRIGDAYYLYGNRLTPFDRDRATMRIDAELESAQDALIDYDLYFHLEHSSVDDLLDDSTATATASTPGFGVNLAAGDDTLRGRLGVDYQISSLQYGRSSTTPNWVAAHLDIEWHPAPALLLTLGGLYSGAQSSDTSEAQTMMLPRISARLQAGEDLALYAWYAPELRAASYRNRIMRAPYIDREQVLRAEHAPINVAAGARFETASITLDGRVRFETATNTPVVVADTAVVGHLRYAHVESRTLAIVASAQTQLSRELGALVEAEFGSRVDEATDEQLPMTPQITVRARADYAVTPALKLTATARFESEQRASLEESSRMLGSRLLLDAGASLDFSETIGLFVEVTNLLGASYDLWDGYSAPGLELRGGARLTF